MNKQTYRIHRANIRQNGHRYALSHMSDLWDRSLLIELRDQGPDVLAERARLFRDEPAKVRLQLMPLTA